MKEAEQSIPDKGVYVRHGDKLAFGEEGLTAREIAVDTNLHGGIYTGIPYVSDAGRYELFGPENARRIEILMSDIPADVAIVELREALTHSDASGAYSEAKLKARLQTAQCMADKTDSVVLIKSSDRFYNVSPTKKPTLF